MYNYLETMLKRINEIKENFEETKDYLEAYQGIEEITTTNWTLFRYDLIETDIYESVSDSAYTLKHKLEVEDFCKDDEDMFL